jgi:hypothetical protein
MLGLKGSKKKKGKKLDEDWVVRALTFYAVKNAHILHPL